MNPRKNNDSTPKNNESNTRELKELGRITDNFCALLAKNSLNHIKPPFPRQYQALADREKISIIVSFENEDVVLPNNTKAFILNEAKKYFRQFPKFKKIKVEVKTSTQEVLNETFFKKTAASDDPSLKAEKKKEAAAQFASNLAALNNTPNLVNEALSKPTIDETLLFLRSYFINEILNLPALEIKFPTKNKEGERISGILRDFLGVTNKLFTEIRTRFDEIESKFNHRIRQFCINEYSPSYPDSNNCFSSLQIKNGKTIFKTKGFFLSFPNWDKSENSKIQAWSLTSTEITIAENAFTALQKLFVQFNLLKSELLEPYYVLYLKIQSGLRNINSDSHSLLMGESLDAFIYNQSQSIFDTWEKEGMKKGFSDFEDVLQANLSMLNDSLSKSRQVLLTILNSLGLEIPAPASVSTSQFSLLPPPVSTNNAFNPKLSSSDALSSASFDYIGLTDKKSVYEYKKEAEEMIQAEQLKRGNRNHHSIDINTTLDQEKQQTTQHEPLVLQLQNKKGSHAIQANLFAGTAHLYLSFDIEIYPSNKFDAFKKAALSQKILTQDSLGKNGIKLYGLNCMIVKCKEYKGEHLLCIAHKIQDTNHYVYLPYEIISHRRYEELLNNKNLLEQLTNKARAEIIVTSNLENKIAAQFKL